MCVYDDLMVTKCMKDFYGLPGLITSRNSMRSSRTETVMNIKETNPRTAAVNVRISLCPSIKTMYKKNQTKTRANQQSISSRMTDVCAYVPGCCRPLLDVDTSRGVGKIWANFRRACFLAARHKCFDVFIIVIIILSTAAMVNATSHQPFIESNG